VDFPDADRPTSSTTPSSFTAFVVSIHDDDGVEDRGDDIDDDDDDVSGM
jgi:hypothetical protein